MCFRMLLRYTDCVFTKNSIAHLKKKHAKSHRKKANFMFWLGTDKCPYMFKTFSIFKWCIPMTKRTCVLQNIAVNLSCNFQNTTFSTFCEQLKSFIKDRKNVPCPLQGCPNYFGVKSTFILSCLGSM